ncbi:MAG: DUF4175 family protein [Micavibrio aeruginosavorus]|uniref:DUF4175 family protein n=1 Tax=Micavibrio aeruginosavorus TaxID=349221 RepID=A0A7T5R144_9BACT|nr:MAG: DUF4175 family protein [Micavibrio aeruginosavorus]
MSKEPKDYQNQPLYDRLARKRFQTRLVLALENVIACFWRMALWGLFFSGLWLLQIPSIAGKSGTIACLIIYLAGLILLFWHDVRHFRWPTLRDIDLRLETSSALAHRPLTALDDKLANPQEQTARALWNRNKSRALVTIYKLKTPLPRPIFVSQDPFALRMLAVLVLVVGIIVAGPAWKERIQIGLNPLYGEEEKKPDSGISIWVTPPTYTGKEQIILQGHGKYKEAIDIPEGSKIKIQVARGFGQPYLRISEQRIPLKRADGKNWSLEIDAPPGGTLKITQMGWPRAHVPYRLIPDSPPEISLVEAPRAIEKGQMQVILKVKDDYSVNDLVMHMRLDENYAGDPLGTAFTDTRAVVSPPATEVELKPVYDLAWHPWAGLPVVIEMAALDHKKQAVELSPIHTTLPERTFQHPVARKLITMRKRLIRAPEAASSNISKELFDIMVQPGAYSGHPVVFLSLKTMSARLAYNPSLENIRGVIAQLWDTALQIEEGNMAMAARNLREAQRNLEATLNDPDATQEQINQALDQFREALANYFQEIIAEMQKQLANGEMVTLPPEMFASVMNPEDLQDFLDELSAQAMAGNKDAAREMLSKLQQTMDSMQTSPGQMQMPKDMQFMMKGISELQKLIEKQEHLLDQTKMKAEPFRKMQQSQTFGEQLPLDAEILKQLWGDDFVPPPSLAPPMEETLPTPSVDTSQNKDEQEALRHMLGQLMQEAGAGMGEIPENMGNAELEMRDAAKHLGGNRPDLSIPHQEAAIEHLKQSMDQMSQKLSQQLKKMMALSMGNGMGKTDPLGRPLQDNENGSSIFPSSKVKIPDGSERKKVRDILDSLRRRSGELERPDYELEYYRRLMQQF